MSGKQLLKHTKSVHLLIFSVSPRVIIVQCCCYALLLYMCTELYPLPCPMTFFLICFLSCSLNFLFIGSSNLLIFMLLFPHLKKKYNFPNTFPKCFFLLQYSIFLIPFIGKHHNKKILPPVLPPKLLLFSTICVLVKTSVTLKSLHPWPNSQTVLFNLLAIPDTVHYLFFFLWNTLFTSFL